MAGYINPDILDNGLGIIDTAGNSLVICSSLPANYAAVAAVTLGTKTSPTISAPQARTPDGRKVVVSAITDGTVSATGTATHFAILDTTGSRLLAAQALASTQSVTSGNTFTLGAVDIGIPGAIA
jgi:hypothetical protein